MQSILVRSCGETLPATIAHQVKHNDTSDALAVVQLGKGIGTFWVAHKPLDAECWYLLSVPSKKQEAIARYNAMREWDIHWSDTTGNIWTDLKNMPDYLELWDVMRSYDWSPECEIQS